MSLLKYFSEQDPRHGGEDMQLLWPGSPAGLPVRLPRGQPLPMLKDHEQSQGFVREGDFKFKYFKLWLPDDGREYTWVMDRVAAGWFSLACQRMWKDTPEGMAVYVEWRQNYDRVAEPGGLGGGNQGG